MGGFETKKPPVGGFTTLLIALIILFFPMVPGVGLEPTQRERRGILNPLCLPIPPLGQIGAGNEARTRDPDLGKVVLYQLSYSRKSVLLLLLS